MKRFTLPGGAVVTLYGRPHSRRYAFVVLAGAPEAVRVRFDDRGQHRAYCTACGTCEHVAALEGARAMEVPE